jgi:hypothetical protein
MSHTLQPYVPQVKISFNHGWLVQAEAPPGPLFSSFKRVLSGGSHSAGGRQVKAGDVSFYFVHWLTDLAGAEPTPLRGSEKFVLKFPHPVLHSFISSFALVGSLVEQHETSVLEAYLQRTWAESQQTLGAAPKGSHAVALMRLVTQVQHLPLQQRVVSAWRQLDADDLAVLGHEMALTGCEGQSYVATPSGEGGPAFLVYYSPAFLRTAAKTDVLAGLRFLAEVYRQARSLWPFSRGASQDHVTIRVDRMKEHPPSHIEESYTRGESWLLVRHNEREAIVEPQPQYTLDQSDEFFGLDGRGRAYRVLRFWHPSSEKGSDGEREGYVAELAALRRRLLDRAAAPARTQPQPQPPPAAAVGAPPALKDLEA